MIELIKITEENGRQVVSARELHRFLENTDNVNTWFQRQAERAMLEENEDFVSVAILQPSGQTSKDYAVSLNSAKEIAMLNGGEKGKLARKYFIKCEAKLNKPRTHLEVIQSEMALLIEKEQLLLQNNNLNTALDILNDWASIIRIAKLNKVSEKEFDWRLLKQKSTDMGFLIKTAPSPRFGYQNLYHLAVFKACYPKFNYNFK